MMAQEMLKLTKIKAENEAARREAEIEQKKLL
jgi:hypothetical protein